MKITEPNDITFICEVCNSLNHLNNIELKKHNIFTCQSCDKESYFTEGIEYIYVYDSIYSDLIKLGYTTRDPFVRLSEINIATGAINWDVALYYPTLSGYKLEQKMYVLFEEFRVQKKELLDISLEKFLTVTKNSFQILPFFIRQDLNYLKNKVAELSIEETIREIPEPKIPILNCPKCGFKNDNPYAHVFTYCKNCKKVIPRRL